MARILVVEDDQSLREVLRMFLNKSGHDVTVCGATQFKLDLAARNGATRTIRIDRDDPRATTAALMDAMPHGYDVVVDATGALGGRGGEDHDQCDHALTTQCGTQRRTLLDLVEDGGETSLRAGDCAAFPKGSGNGHHLINRSSAIAVYLEVGSRNPNDLATCSDIDMMSSNADGRFVHKDGTPISG